MGNPPFTRKSLLTTLGPVGGRGSGEGGTTLSPAGSIRGGSARKGYIFVRLQVYQRGQRVKKSVISVCRMTKKGQQTRFMEEEGGRGFDSRGQNTQGLKITEK